MDPRDARRVVDPRAARKRAKPKDVLALNELALLWGVSKARFVTQMKNMTGFPDPQPAPKGMGLPANSHVYAAQGAIDAMLAFANRHEASSKAKANRAAAIIGGSRQVAEAASLHSPNDLRVLSRLAMETEEREREQGKYVAAAEVSQSVGDIFSMISDFCAGLPNKIDPHGELPPKARETAREGAADLQLQLYQRVKHLLAPDAAPEGNRDTSHRARKPRARRPRG
jgi:hypothetical protein